MAEKALKKLEDQLNCPICLDTYTDPKLLQCHHACCQSCLARLLTRQQGRASLTCPNCRQVTPVPASGLAGLQSAFRLNFLLEIVNERKGSVGCSEHDGKEVDLYCETCEQLICWKCIMRTGKHHLHDYDELSVALAKYKEEMAVPVKLIEKQTVDATEALATSDAHQREIICQQSAIEAEIHDTFGQIREILAKRESNLIDQLNEIAQDKLVSLEIQKELISTRWAEMDNFVSFMKESFGSSNEQEVLMMKTKKLKQANELATSHQLGALKPNEEADITFDFSMSIARELRTYGQVFAKSSSPTKFCVNLTDIAPVTVKSTCILQACSFDDHPSQRLIQSLECELVSEVTNTRNLATLTKKGENLYEITYQPTVKGPHQLHIKVDGHHIQGSPFEVLAKLPVKKLGTPLLVVRDVKGPQGVAVSKSGEVVVAEKRGYCISLFHPSGTKIRSFGTHGSCEGEFRHLTGVAVDSERNILVTDCLKNSIQKFTRDGVFLTEVGSERSLNLYHPSGIAFNTANYKLYVTDEHDRILILNFDLTFSGSFGEKGGGKGQLNNPRGLASDRSGLMYVADCGNSRIQVFASDGKFLKMFGGYGSGEGELVAPTDVAIDADGMVYVSDRTSNRVSVFTTSGQFVTSFGGWGVEPGEFVGLNSLAVDSAGVLYVCDSGGTLQLF